jgi:hypothetical protein
MGARHGGVTDLLHVLCVAVAVVHRHGEDVVLHRGALDARQPLRQAVPDRGELRELVSSHLGERGGSGGIARPKDSRPAGGLGDATAPDSASTRSAATRCRSRASLRRAGSPAGQSREPSAAIGWAGWAGGDTGCQVHPNTSTVGGDSAPPEHSPADDADGEELSKLREDVAGPGGQQGLRTTGTARVSPSPRSFRPRTRDPLGSRGHARRMIDTPGHSLGWGNHLAGVVHDGGERAVIVQ